MEGLLPVIIALVLSAIFSIRKKKAHPEESAYPQEESPWDDLLRELQSRKESPSPSSPMPASSASSASPAPSEPPVEQSVPAEPTAIPSEVRSEEVVVAAPVSLETVAEEEAESPWASLEQLPEWSASGDLSGESSSRRVASVTSALDLTSLPSEPTFRTLTLQEVNAVSGTPTEGAPTEPDPPFPSGFDPRMAVLYSEVLRPKYQE